MPTFRFGEVFDVGAWMGVGIRVGSITDEIGTADFLHAFFSTISANLEPKWGARFPTLLSRLYQGELRQDEADAALNELATARGELAKLSPRSIVWDFEDRTKSPPWGENIASEISSLADYFVTSTGRDLIDTLAEALESLRNEGGTAKIVSY